MARFRGVVRGGRSGASRLGHATTGLTMLAQSYSGDICVSFWANADKDYVSLSVSPHSCSTGRRLIYSGPVSGLFAAARMTDGRCT